MVPPIESAHGFSHTSATPIWMRPSKNPNHNPELVRKSSSTRPTFWKSCPSFARSRSIWSTTQFSSEKMRSLLRIRSLTTPFKICTLAKRTMPAYQADVAPSTDRQRPSGKGATVAAPADVAATSAMTDSPSCGTAPARCLATCPGFNRAKASGTVSSWVWTMSTSALDMVAVLQGTIPCQPRSPSGTSARRQIGMPLNCTG
mmetsp:Transcript_9305/g.27770  ORF Transcript_9305/g.27770 Transcript_9305/m.27770 type:complete len:202 (+) Transcript_9305:1292-1897(+)